METINDNNYELWLVRYADGCLTADEREAVEQWLEGHPEAAEELALYGEAPRLERDESVRYVAQQHTRPLWPAVLRWSAAAAVILLLLSPVVWHNAAPQEEGMQVAQVREVPAVDTLPTAPAAVPMATPAKPEAPSAMPREEKPTEPQRQLEEAENYLPTRPMVLQPMPVAEAEEVERGEWIEESGEWREGSGEPQMVYVDNLFVEDTLDDLEQRLLSLNNDVREGLQGTYLGRRLARRLLDDEELLARVDERRQRTPRGLRMVADFISTYSEVNK
ncbi:MAG: hypothetical protein IJ524_05940 [Bacteroidales bacterium]|nr:hypothetical protein [Bacteroidales bacterium]